MNIPLKELLYLAAAGQFTVAFLNLSLVSIMHWQKEVLAMPLLIREVFHVHKWFVSISLWIFAILTFMFADRFAAGGDPLAQALAGAIAIFWGVRSVLQFAYYSKSHWVGIPSRIAVHIILGVAYPYLTVVYALAAFR